MAISSTALKSWTAIGTYLKSLTDRDGNLFFSNVTYSSNINLYTDGKLMATIRKSDYPDIVLKCVSGESGETTSTANSIDVTLTQAYHTRNGCCINFYSDDEHELFIGVGKTQSGETFICAGIPHRQDNGYMPLFCSHIYNSNVPYTNIEGASILTNQTALYAEPVCTVEGKKDRWDKFYYNKCSQVKSGTGAMTFEGSVYYTNTFISILDD